MSDNLKARNCSWLTQSQVFSIVLVAVSLDMVALGVGTPSNELSPDVLDALLKLQYASGALHLCAVCFTRLSAVCFYARIFSISGEFRIALWSTTGLILSAFFAMLITGIFQCSPVYAAWTPQAIISCIDTYEWFLAEEIVSAIVDIVILVLPLPVVWHLQLKPMRKFLVGLVFLSGYM